ncbi:haloacid dehalogenase-like hydrolase [Candidatus Uhrbacteria bacterium]|nr:haloacid dehalogenase-like hydrolase [Candidatus Uhrbacteria bacterium]
MNTPSHVVVFDNDGTFTPKGPGNAISLVNTVDNNAGLPETAKKELQALRDEYMAPVLNGALSHRDQREWMHGTLGIYHRHGLDLNRARGAVSRLSIRPGVKECLILLRDAGIPRAIVSFGVADFIEAYLATHGIAGMVDSVYAARLRFFDGIGCYGSPENMAKTGICDGYDPDSIIVPANKGEASRHFADLYRVPHDRILAVGDSGGDKYLGHAKENRLLIASDDKEAAKISAFAGTVVVTDDFAPVTQWLKSKLGLT